MTTDIIIPARFDSTRFPGKPLALIGGIPMICHVLQAAQKIRNIRNIYVATDHEQIKTTIENAGGQVILTRSDHLSGTDRIAEALSKISSPPDIVLNIQGDEPFFPSELGEKILALFYAHDVLIASAAVPFMSNEEPNDPNRVKVTFRENGSALTFSRSLLPFPSLKPPNYWKHLGVYAYRSFVLENISKLTPSNLEISESLEQLRWLEKGYNIYITKYSHFSISVDTPQDLVMAEKVLSSQKNTGL